MSTYTPFEQEILSMVKDIKTDMSELKSDVSVLKTEMVAVRTTLWLLEGDIEYLEIEWRAEGAATRALLIEYIQSKKTAAI